MPSKKESPIGINVPITPMLDMSFQLLAFFLLTFKPMPTEGQLSVSLPKPDPTVQPLQDLPDPDGKKDEYTITVHSSAAGDVALLGLRGPTANVDNIKSLTDLSSELKQIPRPGNDASKVSITIESARDLQYARLIEVMDVSKKAGFGSANLAQMR